MAQYKYFDVTRIRSTQRLYYLYIELLLKEEEEREPVLFPAMYTWEICGLWY